MNNKTKFLAVILFILFVSPYLQAQQQRDSIVVRQLLQEQLDAIASINKKQLSSEDLYRGEMIKALFAETHVVVKWIGGEFGSVKPIDIFVTLVQLASRIEGERIIIKEIFIDEESGKIKRLVYHTGKK